MAKAKRGKSGSASDVLRWDSELIKLPYVEDDWKPFIVFLVPSKSTDLPVISLLSDIINTGVRKLFSVVEYNSLLDEVKELAASQGKAAKGKPATTTRPPQFLEVCEQAKSFMDQGEPISASLLAKIIKFKMLMLKNKDLDRREAEKKIAMMDSKQRVESRPASKSSGRKSASPGKGKKTAKKEEPAPTAKKDTQLKKRGEEGDDFKTIDDEPDGIMDPHHYIVITGFTDASLLTHLNDMKIPLNAIINLDTDYHLKMDDVVDDDPSICSTIDKMDSKNTVESKVDHKDYELKLAMFWEESNTLVKNAPHGHHLHNMAKFEIFVEDKSLPDVSFDILDAEKKNQFSIWLFNKLADICYDLLDYYQQFKVYQNNLQIIDVSASAYPKAITIHSPDSGAAEGDQELSGVDASTSEASPVSLDMRYYNHLMGFIPMENDCVPLVMHCLLEQVVASVDDTHPMDDEPPKREDGLDDVLGRYLDEKLTFYGLDNKQDQLVTPSIDRTSPHIIYHGNESGFRLCNFPNNDYFNPFEIEKKLLDLHPYSIFKTCLQMKNEGIVESFIRHRQFYNFCNDRFTISEDKFERAMRQYIFESLPYGNNSGDPDAYQEAEGLGKALNHWDDLYFNLLNSGSSLAVVKESSENLAGQLESQNLDNYCCLEKFSSSILLQVLQKAHDLRPYLDTYYNKGNNTLLVVLQNPSNDTLQNNHCWSSWLHSDVGFKNYLEYVAIEIQNWTQEQERLAEAKSKAMLPEPEVPLAEVTPVKERSRWGMKTRAEMEKEKEEEDKGEKRKKSGKRSSSPKKSASRSPQKKKSEKNVRRSTSGKKENSISSISKVSMVSDEVPVENNPDKEYDFIGYNLGDNIVHLSGDIAYLFPQDGSLIKVERTKYTQGNNYIQVSVIKCNGDAFSLNLVNPCENIPLLEEEWSDLDNKDTNASIETSLDTVLTHDDNELDTSNASTNGIPALPSFPDIEARTCSYSNLKASFADGMIIVCSNSIPEPPEKRDVVEAEPSFDPSESIPAEVTVQAKSAKGKGKKKEEDTKAQDESEKLRAQEMESQRQLLQRLNDIKRLIQDSEAVKNLYVTTPNALHVSFLHHMHVDYFDSVIYKQSSFLVKLENFARSLPCESSKSGVMSELYRSIMEDGTVVQYLSDSTVKVLSPKGDIMQSTPFTQDGSKSDESKQGGRPSSMKSPKDIIGGDGTLEFDNSGKFMEVDWFITYLSGKQKILKSDGTEEDVDGLLMSDAKCYDTNEVLRTRGDGVIIVSKPDGSTTVEHLDGTRVTTYSDNKADSSLNLIKIEHESLATVLVNIDEMSISVIYGNNKVIKGMKQGGYIVSKNESCEMVIDTNGNASLNPSYEINLSPENSVELPSNKTLLKNACFLQQSCDECLSLTDSVGNKFSVNLFGDYNIEKPPNHPSKSVILPRYFVIYPDGNGEELLRYEDVGDYIKQAEADPSTAVFRAPVEGDGEADTITIIKPHHGPPSKVWQPKKDMDNIIPNGLRERDFTSFPPFEQKKEGPRLGTRIVAPYKEMKKDEKFPDILEIRHFIKYKEIMSAVREQIIKDVGDYSEYVHLQQQWKHSLSSKESRVEEEISIAEKIKANYIRPKKEFEDEIPGMDCTENIKTMYIDTITPTPPEPIPYAQPERPSAEWEKDKIELAELNHSKAVIRNKDFPKYFDTEEGQQFLMRNGVFTPDMEKLTRSLAHETQYPPLKSPSLPSTPTEILNNNRIPPAESTPYLEDSSLTSIHSSTMSVLYNSSTVSEVESTFNSKVNSSRPVNPTPRQADLPQTSNESSDDSKLDIIDEISFTKSQESDGEHKKMLRSLTHDVSGEIRKQPVETPKSIRGSRPNAVPNETFNRIEEPVRRQVKTASIAGLKHMKETTRLRGFVLIPDNVDFGVLKEGLAYSYKVTLKNVGIDACRFKIKQPPPSTGLKVKYQPGPVAAGMSITFDIEIFAVAVGVDGTSGIGQVSYCVEIITETDLLYFPVNATIITQGEEFSPSENTPRGGPSKGTLILTERPSSRETLTRPRKV